MRMKYAKGIVAVVAMATILLGDMNLHPVYAQEKEETTVQEQVDTKMEAEKQEQKEHETEIENQSEEYESESKNNNSSLNFEEPLNSSDEETYIEESMEDTSTYSVTANQESDFTWNGTIVTGYKGNSKNVVIPAKATQISSSAFSYNKNIESVSFAGKNLTSIEPSAFYSCTALKSVVFPDSLKKIGNLSFKECNSITSIVLPASVNAIGQMAFSNCNSLSYFEIKGNIQSAGSDIFAGCMNLNTVKLSNKQTVIPEYLFRNASYITSVSIPDSVTEIEESAFNGCSSLTSVRLSSNLITVGKSAFSGCNSLTSIIIPNSVNYIYSYAFRDCTSLKSIVLSSNLIEIGYGAFEKCQALKEIVIPQSVKKIGYYALENCLSLNKVTIYSPDVELDSSIFNGDLVVKIYGLTGSTAQEYATKNNISFVSIGYTPGWYRWSDGELRLFDENGQMVTNQFAFDGSYTYYLQADGTPMKDRLTYHPDGKHIIYFDEDGHEVFNAFQYCPSVGYTCYFDSQGYIYKNQITYVNGNPYYLNANGKMENSGWFQFANGVDFGYANKNGILNHKGFSYDPWGRIVFYHWNGMVARGLITDGSYYYLMDEKDGHYLGSFPVK